MQRGHARSGLPLFAFGVVFRVAYMVLNTAESSCIYHDGNRNIFSLNWRKSVHIFV